MRGRGAKHFFPSGSVPGETYLNTRISQDSRHVPRTSHIVSSKSVISVLFHALVLTPSSGYVFVNALLKSRKISVRKRSLNRLIVLASYINGGPLSDRSKPKVQTTSRQEPCHTPQMPFAKINYFSDGRTYGRTPVFLHYRMERALRAIIRAIASKDHPVVDGCETKGFLLGS